MRLVQSRGELRVDSRIFGDDQERKEYQTEKLDAEISNSIEINQAVGKLSNEEVIAVLQSKITALTVSVEES